MTTTPLPPLPEPLRVIFNEELGHQMYAYTTDHMESYAQQARADLEAENKRLRETFDSLAERFSNMDANGDKWISTVAAAAMTLRALEKQP